MNISLIKTTVRQWVVNVLGEPVIFVNQNGDIPGATYTTLLFGPITKIGHDELLPVDTTGDGVFCGDRQFTVSVQIFGADSMNKAVLLTESLERESSRALLQTQGISFVESLSILDTTELLDTGFEERASVDMLFAVGSTHGENVGVIESIELTETYNDEQGTVLTRTTIV